MSRNWESIDQNIKDQISKDPTAVLRPFIINIINTYDLAEEMAYNEYPYGQFRIIITINNEDRQTLTAFINGMKFEYTPMMLFSNTNNALFGTTAGDLHDAIYKKINSQLHYYNAIPSNANITTMSVVSKNPFQIEITATEKKSGGKKNRSRKRRKSRKRSKSIKQKRYIKKKRHTKKKI
jgi:hypothetical protein